MGLRELLILVLILAIVGVIVRGLYVALRARRGQLRMVLEKNVPQYDPDEIALSELPNGGARLVERSFAHVVRQNSEFSSRDKLGKGKGDQAIPVLMDSVGNEEEEDASPVRTSSVAHARHAARQRHSTLGSRTVVTPKPTHRPIDVMPPRTATVVSPAAAPASFAGAESSKPYVDPLDSHVFKDAPEEELLYEEDAPYEDEPWEDEEVEEIVLAAPDQDDEDDDDYMADDDYDDEPEEDDLVGDYDQEGDDSYAAGVNAQLIDEDGAELEFDEDDDDFENDADDRFDEPESVDDEDEYEEDDYDEPEAEEFDSVYGDDSDSRSERRPDVIVPMRAGDDDYDDEVNDLDDYPEEEEEKSGPRRWLQWAGDKITGMTSAAVSRGEQERERDALQRSRRAERAEPTIGGNSFDDSLQETHIPAPAAAPQHKPEPLHKSRQSELNLDEPHDDLFSAPRQGSPRHSSHDGYDDDVSPVSEKATPPRVEKESQAPRREERAAAAKPAETQAPVEYSEVLVLNVVAKPEREFTGVDLLPVLLTTGLRFGDMNIFHRHLDNDTRGPVLFSVANIVNPGTFDLNQINDFATRGLCFFMTLPNVANSMQAFDLMLDVAQQVRIALDGDLKDDNRSVMTAQTIEHYRQRVRDFDLRQLRQPK